MTRHERFAATALQGLIAARTNLDIAGEVEMAWRYGDAMEDTARQRELLLDDEDSPGARAAKRDALADQGIETVELVANERYECALTRGLEAAQRDDEFTDREAAILNETIGNFGLAVSVGDDREYQRCELSDFQCWCRTYSFHVDAGAGAQ